MVESHILPEEMRRQDCPLQNGWPGDYQLQKGKVSVQNRNEKGTIYIYRIIGQILIVESQLVAGHLNLTERSPTDPSFVAEIIPYT